MTEGENKSIVASIQSFRRLVATGCQIKKILSQAKDSSKRLLLITHELTSSGSSMLLANLCLTYSQMGYFTVVLTADTRPAPPEIERTLNSSGGLLVLNFRSEIRLFFLRILQKAGFSHAICNTVISGFFAEDLKKAEIHSIYLIHEMTASLHMLHAQHIAANIAAMADAIVFPAEKVKQTFLSFISKEIATKKIFIQPQGFRNLPQISATVTDSRATLRKKFNLPLDTKVLLGAGAINFGKGLDLCLPVLKKLNTNNPQSPYHLIWLGAINGDDPYYLWLNIQINACGLNEYVHFTGFVQDTTQYAEILCGSDLFFLSSREDSFPSTMIEALVMQLPVLTFDQGGGGAEYITQIGAGISVPMGDTDAACAAIHAIEQDRYNYANANTVFAAKNTFDFEHYAKKLLNYLGDTSI